MIITEDYMVREDGVELIRRYSDRNVMIENVNTGERFEDVVDPKDSGREYKETEIEIEAESEGPPPFMIGGEP